MLVKLKDICNITMGQSPDSSYYNTSGDGLPFLQGRTTFGRVYPYYETWTTSYNKCANPNDLLMSVRAPVGDMNICQTKTALGRGVAAIHPINISFLYVYYLLIANKDHICSRSTGSVYDSISKPDLENLQFNIHSNEQIQHIVNTIHRYSKFP